MRQAPVEIQSWITLIQEVNKPGSLKQVFVEDGGTFVDTVAVMSKLWQALGIKTQAQSSKCCYLYMEKKWKWNEDKEIGFTKFSGPPG